VWLTRRMMSDGVRSTRPLSLLGVLGAVLERAKRPAMICLDRVTRRVRPVLAGMFGRGLLLQAARFAAVGVVNNLVDFCVFLFAITYLTSSLTAANTTSWLVSVTGSYVMNSFITFAVESGRQLNLGAFMRFVGSAIFGLIANTMALLIAVKVLLVPILVGKVLAIGVSFAVNFSLARFVVFRQRRPQVGDVA
jgi:putative flippase GtrA